MSDVIAIGVYFVVTAIIAGIVREVEGDWPDWIGVVAFWPFAPAFATVFGVTWCLQCIGRGPVVLVRRLRTRRYTLPKCEVKRG